MQHQEGSSLFRQPKAVWAVAFACVIAFMGIGLVDPILPALATSLDATPSQVELLFTSYFAITGIAMLITGFVSSRIGAKRTLLAGLALIVAFSAAAGASGSINEIVAFRGVWGLGNALFIATALSAIVGAASGGVAGAIVLFEAALGLGIASGPLLGGELGSLSWRAPFFGVATLMAIAFVAILILLEKTPAPAHPTSLGAPLRALGDRGLLGLALTALFYNFGFFTLIAFTPFPLELGIHQLGYVFFGWGVLLAFSSVFVAPRVHRRVGLLPALYGAFALVALDLLGMAIWTDSQEALIVLVILAGLFLGVVNTLITETVMRAAPGERSTASAAYSFVRFIGGAAAPYLAGKLAEHFNPSVPFYVAAGSVTLAIVVLALHRDWIRDPHAVAAPEPASLEFAEELLEADAA
jgi:predicted MFS family arabinose efflux permease